MDVIAWIVLGLGAGVLANMLIPGRPRPGRHLRRRDPRLRAPRLGHQGALAYARPP